MHYSRWWKTGSVDLLPTPLASKVCAKCGLEKLVNEFHASARSAAIATSTCRACRKKAYAVGQAERSRRAHLRKAYGLTPGQYEALLAEQGGGCGICGRTHASRRLFVDHDHRTGAVRGILCSSCNRALGYMADQPDRLRQAAAYLERGESDSHRQH